MGPAAEIVGALERTVAEALGDMRIRGLLEGRMEKDELRAFFRRFAVTHLSSVQLLALLYSLAPPEAAGLVKENLLEEMGLEEADRAHPELVLDVLDGLGFSQREVDRVVAEAADERREFATAPLRYATLRGEGLAVLLETLAFETFLSRVSDSVATALQRHYGLSAEAVQWFTLHGEVDIRHAQEGQQVVERFISTYEFWPEEVESIANATFASNVILQRYFPPGPERAVSAGARVESVEIMPLRIPFTRAFAHATQHREASDTVIVRVHGAGVSGYGEALPRPYVTGEDVSAMVEALENIIAPSLAEREFGAGRAVVATLQELRDEWRQALLPTSSVRAWNAAQCSIELALLDWAFRRADESIGAWLLPARQSVTYSGVIDAVEPGHAAELAERYASAGIDTVKVKVGLGDDVARVEAARAVLGTGARIRLDTNGVWTAEEAIRAIRNLEHCGIGAVEQPVAAGDLAGMRRVREETGVAVIADESLITQEDAERLIEERACDVFNVRVSKCGGLLPAREIAELGIASGLKVVVGAQVGETSLLSAAGRHLAAHLTQVEYVEGSFGTRLLEEDITAAQVAFGFGGRGRILFGPGLGVAVEGETVKRLATRIARVLN